MIKNYFSITSIQCLVFNNNINFNLGLFTNFKRNYCVLININVVSKDKNVIYFPRPYPSSPGNFILVLTLHISGLVLEND